MPTPNYSAGTTAAAWTRQSGAVHGIEGTKVFFDVPYRGREDHAGAFRETWKKGAQCDIAGFTHLFLKEGPIITDEPGGLASCTLRFEGTDINGEFGETEPTVTRYYNEARTFEAYAEGRRVPVQLGVYRYNASVAVVSYTDTSKQSEAQHSPSLDDPPGPTTLESGARDAISGERMLAETGYWRVISNSGFLDITDNGDGTFSHEEYHERILEGVWT